MSQIVSNCPRCQAKLMTFDVKGSQYVGDSMAYSGFVYEYEVYAICGACSGGTIFQVETSGSAIGSKRKLEDIPGVLNHYLRLKSYVSIKDICSSPPPEHLPKKILEIFNEGAKCKAVGCNNAAGTMFRLCLDVATQELLPKEETEGVTRAVKERLFDRLKWLFENEILPANLKELSDSVRKDGNDGAHEGTLKIDDVNDLCDFTTEILQTLYTVPERLKLNKQRREARRT